MAWIDLSLPMDDCDFFIYLRPFPPGPIHGAVTPNPDGTYSMFIDSNALPDVQQEAYWHEYTHLACEDFTNGRPIEEIEDR